MIDFRGVPSGTWEDRCTATADGWDLSLDEVMGVWIDNTHTGRWFEEAREIDTQLGLVIGTYAEKSGELLYRAREKWAPLALWGTYLLGRGIKRSTADYRVRVYARKRAFSNFEKGRLPNPQPKPKPKPKGGDDDHMEAGTPLYDAEQIVASAFAYYRRVYPKGSYPYRNLPIHVSMQQINKLAQMTSAKHLRSTNLGRHVADTYHPHRYHATAVGMKSPFETFSDDDNFKAALRKELEQGGHVGDEGFSMLAVSQGTQACGNFRPGYAAYLYRRYCPSGPGAVVLDTSTGYGGRLVGFMASGRAGTYIGIDPNTQTHEGNLKMVRELGFSPHVELINLPVEDVDPERFAGRCDFAFTSPPYFTKEHYSDEDTQSWKRYPTPAAWRQGFLQPMLRLTYSSLKPGAFALLNVARVILNGEQYAVDDWTQADAIGAGFGYIDTLAFPLPRIFGRTNDDTDQ